MDFLKTMFRGLTRLILREPTATQALVVAVIALGTAFGLEWNGVQVGAVSAVSAAVLGWLTRQVVTPLAAPVIQQGTTITVETPPGQKDERVTV